LLRFSASFLENPNHLKQTVIGGENRKQNSNLQWKIRVSETEKGRMLK